jgi:hypothetical protein
MTVGKSYKVYYGIDIDDDGNEVYQLKDDNDVLFYEAVELFNTISDYNIPLFEVKNIIKEGLTFTKVLEGNLTVYAETPELYLIKFDYDRDKYEEYETIVDNDNLRFGISLPKSLANQYIPYGWYKKDRFVKVSN